MEVKELGHLVLYVRNVRRSAEFYRDVLGWKEIEQPMEQIALFSGGRTHHELLLIEVGEDAQPMPKGRRVGMYHFGLKVGESDEELSEALERVLEAGVKVVGSADHNVTHSLYIEDPDGNEIELYVDVPGVDWRKDPQAIMTPAQPLAL